DRRVGDTRPAGVADAPATAGGLPVRESLLKALARRQRPAASQDPGGVAGRTPAPDEGAGMTPVPTGRPGG
ncbi:hypothetical protein, partial [Micromonospora sp. HK10]|uniref:hypothetical protein n=1 Tax=Micromonospora sp. HK10 TaxID=1538294 RepID=UPI001E33561F